VSLPRSIRGRTDKQDFQTLSDVAVPREYQTAARQAGRRLVPVYLHCNETQNLQRVDNEDRVNSGTTKLLSRDLLTTIRGEAEPFRFEDEDAFDLDVSSVPPVDAAKAIISHIRRYHFIDLRDS
jgi:hypothetical protein